jgi:hypothetical protein
MKPLFFRAMAAVATVLSIELFGLCAGTAQAQQQRKPNILFILADNIGYGDIGVYSSGALLRGATEYLHGDPSGTRTPDSLVKSSDENASVQVTSA